MAIYLLQSRSSWLLALVSALGASAIQITSDAAASSSRARSAANTTSSDRTISELKNFGDVQFTAEIIIGAQQLDAVVDTGSFDLIVFSAACGSACGPNGLLYDDDASSSYKAGELETVQRFGSGAITSQESWETIGLGKGGGGDGSPAATHQVFWKAYKSDMSITRDGTFQAILGVGPPESAVLLAKWALDKAKGRGYIARRTQQRTFRVEKVGVNGVNDIDNLEDLYEHAQKEKSFVETAGIRVMSICLEKSRGGGGTFIWNDYAPESRPAGTFLSMKNVGDIYWSAGLSNVRIGDEAIGCASDRCSGIVDTGTSLISAPAKVGRYVDRLVSELGDCSDLSSLPDLEFELGGKQFSLPPESYVGKVDNWWSLKEEMRPLMPQLQAKAMEFANKTAACKSILMTTESVGPNGEEWIIGLPLFRKYYTTFVFDKDWKAESMHFSEADGSCEPTGDGRENLRAEASKSGRGQNVLMVDASKLRAPAWALASTSSSASGA